MTRSISIDFLIGLVIGLILAGLWLQRNQTNNEANRKREPFLRRVS